MKIIKPNFFDEFHCLANNCKNTCCANWEIEIDNKSLLKYSNTKKLENIDDYSIKKNKNYIFKTQNNRCIFLDDDNLCKIVKKYGDKYLCEICNEFPRFYINLKTYRFVGLGLDCEKVVEIVLNLNNAISFNISETNKKFDTNEDKRFIKFNEILSLTKKYSYFYDFVINYLNLSNIKDSLNNFDFIYETFNIKKIQNINFEWLNGDSKKLFTYTINNFIHKQNFSDIALKNLFICFLYKHYFDNRIKSNEKTIIKYSIFMAICCDSLVNLNNHNITENISKFVRQVEDNFENIKLLFNLFLC